MKKNLLYIVAIAVFSLLFASFSFAQVDQTVSAAGDVYVISAKAGNVSYTEGSASVIRKNGKSGYLVKDEKLEIGDKVSTGADGKAEILLNPGSYLRLGSNSGFEFVTTDLNDLKLKLNNGVAILEVFAADEFKVSVELPNAQIGLTRSGVFRIDVLSDGTGKISVWKGKVYVGAEKQEVKAGRYAFFGKGNASIAKFDRDNKDEFDNWSKVRAKGLAEINARLQRDALRNSLLNTYNRGVWNIYNSIGVWVFNPVLRRWCFLPFGSGWGSPYGYDYSYDLWYCRLPRYVYIDPPPPSTAPQVPPTNPPPSQANIDRATRNQTPPFQRINPSGDREERPSRNSSTRNYDTTSSDTNRDNSDRNSRRDNDSKPTYNDSKPTYTPPPPPPPTPIIVSPSKTDKDN
jgi:hypothetical protein